MRKNNLFSQPKNKQEQQIEDHQLEQQYFRSRQKHVQDRRKIRQQILKQYREKIQKKQQKQQENLIIKKQQQIIKKDIEQQKEQQIDIFAQNLNYESKLENQEKRTLHTDQNGYYNVLIGEIIGTKYKIIQKIGKGVFGVVVKAQIISNQKENQLVAIKILRKNQVTQESGIRQHKILSNLNHKKLPGNQNYIITVYEQFYQNNHLCIVCQLLGQDLRSFIQRNKINLQTIREYCISIFIGLHNLRKNKIIHSDIKPDNFLIDINNGKIKISDFGTAYQTQQHVMNQQLVARYYRAPQIILGTQIQKDLLFGIDVWAVGCTLYELYTGDFLFSANTNNQLLKQIMETRGKFNLKMLKKSTNLFKYFDQNYNFLYNYIDKNSKIQKIQKMQIHITAQRQMMALLKKTWEINKNQDIKKLQNFKDLLQKCLALNPKDRIIPVEALMHPFINYQIKLD